MESTENQLSTEPSLLQNRLLCEESLAELFKSDMLLEMRKNSHKGSVLDFKDFEGIITELEYHKAKLFMAIRVKNKGAIREYIADTANFLLVLGNLFQVYENENPVDECFEINKDVDIFKVVKVSDSQRGQKVGS